jgi:hypothetical protein
MKAHSFVTQGRRRQLRLNGTSDADPTASSSDSPILLLITSAKPPSRPPPAPSPLIHASGTSPSTADRRVDSHTRRHSLFPYPPHDRRHDHVAEPIALVLRQHGDVDDVVAPAAVADDAAHGGGGGGGDVDYCRMRRERVSMCGIWVEEQGGLRRGRWMV